MTQRLLPPPGYASWIDYAVENMETRSLELEALFDGEKHWPQGTTREQMRQAVQAELAEIRQAIQQLQPVSEVVSGTQLTVKQVIECLRRQPAEAVVLVEGHETGWDVIHAIRQATVVKYRKVKDWDGEYQEANQFKQPGDSFLAVLIEGRRGHRRSR